MKTFEEIEARVKAIVHDNKDYITGTIAEYLIDAINNNDSEIYSYIKDGENPDNEKEKVIEYIRENFNYKLSKD